MAKWKPFVGYQLSDVTFKHSWKRYKDFKVFLNNFPETLKDTEENRKVRREAVAQGLRASFVKTVGPVVLDLLKRRWESLWANFKLTQVRTT